ncbi:ROK family transcriptional regulator [Tessaracoccus terricola]
MLSTNRERAVAALISQGPMHRADLARVLSVSRTTVTNVVSGLLEAGLVAEETGGGLKSKVSVTDGLGVLVSVVFRISGTVVAIGGADGRVLREDHSVEGVNEPGSVRLADAARLVRKLLAELGDPRVHAAHVAVNTQMDVRSGEVIGGEASSMWAGTNPREAFEELLGGVPVLLENTARLMSLVEHLAVSGQRPRNLVYVHLSHGVAMGQVLEGRIVQGGHGGAGELGHVSIEPDGIPCSCANQGCLMQYVGQRAVEARASAILGPGATIAELVSKALEGSHACRALVADIGVFLGRAMVGVFNLVDPDVVVVGGELAGSGEILTEPVARTVRNRALPLATRGLRVLTAVESQDPSAVARAGLHILRADEGLVEDIVRAAGV